MSRISDIDNLHERTKSSDFDSSEPANLTQSARTHEISAIEKRHAILVDVEQGWHKLVIQADAMLTHLDPNYKAIQIKQKFGDLRYYFTTKADELVSEMMQIIVDHFEEISGIVCERCGETGSLRDVGGWSYTLCDTHWQEAKK